MKIKTKDKDLLRFYNNNRYFRKDFSNIIGYERDWDNNPINLAFTNKTSNYYYIKKMQTEIYLKLITPYLKAKTNLKILDFGGGIGRFIPYFINKCYRYDFVESCKSNIKFTAQKYSSNSKLFCHWQTLESFRSNIKYDLILAPEILCYHKAPIKLLNQLKNMLAQSGKLLLSVENINCCKLFYNSKLEKLDNSKYFPYLLYKKNDYYVRPTTQKLLTSCLQNNKLKTLKSGYLFNKLEGGNYNQLRLNKLEKANKNSKTYLNEISNNKKINSNDFRAIYTVIQK